MDLYVYIASESLVDMLKQCSWTPEGAACQIKQTIIALHFYFLSRANVP